MADFCKQCSEALFTEDFGDMAGLCTAEENERGLFACVLCEGCGATQVTADGTCIHHGKPESEGGCDPYVA